MGEKRRVFYFQDINPILVEDIGELKKKSHFAYLQSEDSHE